MTVPKAPAELVAKVIDEYPKLGSKKEEWGSKLLNTFALYSDDHEKQVFREAHVCHSRLPHVLAGAFDNLITSYPVPDQGFFNFLKNVLYRQFKDHFHLVEVPNTLTYYIIITGLDKIPANVVFNFCIASRVPVEFPGTIVRWSDYVFKGMHPSFAFAMAMLEDKGNSNHFPVDNQLNLKTLVSGKLQNLSAPFKSNPAQCFPCNKIWGRCYDLKERGGLSAVEFWNKWKDQEHDQDILLTP